MIKCDVCDRIIFEVICPYCGYNNVDQLESSTLEDEILDCCDSLDALDDEVIINVIIEIYGISLEEAQKIIYGE